MKVALIEDMVYQTIVYSKALLVSVNCKQKRWWKRMYEIPPLLSCWIESQHKKLPKTRGQITQYKMLQPLTALIL